MTILLTVVCVVAFSVLPKAFYNRDKKCLQRKTTQIYRCVLNKSNPNLETGDVCVCELKRCGKWFRTYRKKISLTQNTISDTRNEPGKRIWESVRTICASFFRFFPFFLSSFKRCGVLRNIKYQGLEKRTRGLG